MNHRRRAAALAVVTVVALTAAVSPPATATAAPATPRTPTPQTSQVPPPADAPGTPDASITLVTGDRVRVTGGRVSVEPARGRARIGFSRYTSRGDTYVVPADAAALTAAGRVDRRLFNITQLVRHGYDDSSRASLPLIAVAAPAAGGRSRAVQLPGATVSRKLPQIGATAVRAAKSDAPRLWAAVTAGGPARAGARGLAGTGVDKLLLDGPVRASLHRSVAAIGAPTAWAAGLTGKGVTVAVVDSGIDAKHPDLADAVTAAVDLSGGRPGAGDAYGHGTHVASIITGSGVAHERGYRGVAPDALLQDVKVLDEDGRGTESTILAGLEWAATHGAKVANVSLGIDFSADGSDLLSAAVDRLTAQTGTLFVVAAGNSGPDAGTIASPAAAESALTVGAVDREDRLAYFSARGPRYLNEGVKPDITAPGVGIVAALAGAGHTDGPYMARSGTSMAAPHVAGAAAILAAQHPDWTPAQLKATLMGTAVPGSGYSVYEQGAGRLDLARAVSQRVFATTPNLNAGVVAWPHTDDAPIVRPVTFTNAGASTVTLQLAFDVRDPSGEPAPAGMFTVDTPALTVPPGGRAVATVTTDTRVPAPLGVYGGVFTATGPDGVAVRIPVGVDVEPERYDVTVSVRDRRGAATADYGFRFVDLDTQAEYHPWAPSGTVVARLPRGRYRFDGLVRSGADTVIAIEPEIVVDHDQPLVVSGAEGHRVHLGVERPGARIGTASLTFDTTAGGDTTVGYSWLGGQDGFGAVYVRPSSTAHDAFRFAAEASLARPSADGQFRDSPYLYQLRADTERRVPDGVTRTFADADLARVDTVLAAAAPGRTGVRGIVETALPATLTEFYTPGHAWYPDFAQYGPRGREHVVSSVVRVHGKGEVSSASWNTAVFGPSLPHRTGRHYLAERAGDQLSFGIPMFADGGVGRSGSVDRPTAQRTALYSGDTLVGTYPFAGQGYFTVPPAAGTYRLRSELSQAGSVTSTSVVADWTFGTAPAPGVTNLPLLAVRFSPVLDTANAAPGGESFAFPVAVQRNGAGLVRSGIALTVDASYDDGATWAPAELSPEDDRWTATVRHPAGPGFVTLRATATDADGNAVTQTITRAYALR